MSPDNNHPYLEGMDISRYSLSSLKDTLTYLEIVFKMTNPSPKDTLAEVQRRAGQQDVLEHLRLQIQAQEENTDVLIT